MHHESCEKQVHVTSVQTGAGVDRGQDAELRGLISRGQNQGATEAAAPIGDYHGDRA